MERRRVRMTAVLLVSLAALSLAGTARAASVKSLALQLSDMPEGFTLSKARYWSDAQAAQRDGVPVALYEAHGRLVSYETEFDRSALFGLLQVDDSVAAYRDAQGAQWVLARNESMTRVATSHKRHFQQMSIRPIGESSMAFAITVKSGGWTYGGDIIYFRRGSYMVTVQGAGIANTFDAGQVTALARVIDSRIRVHG